MTNMVLFPTETIKERESSYPDLWDLFRCLRPIALADGEISGKHCNILRVVKNLGSTCMCNPEPRWVLDSVLDVQGFKVLLHYIEALPFHVCLPGNILEEFHLMAFKHHFPFGPGCPGYSFFIFKVEEMHY